MRLTEAEFEAIRREARRRSWSISQVMRQRTLKGLAVVELVEGMAEEQKAAGQ